jgi:CheY-like chemotaxis protein
MNLQASIVVVEDADDVRELLAFILEGEGFRVIACADADQAFEAVRQERPAVVLSRRGETTPSGVLESCATVRSRPHARR